MQVATEVVEAACAHCGARNRIPRARLHEGPVCGRCREKVFPDRPVAVTEASWAAQVERSPLPVVVDFWASWCMPCRQVAPVLEAVARERAGRVKVVKVNVDENPRLASRFEIRAIPTLLVMKGGRPADRVSGALPKRDLDARLDRIV